MSRTTYLSVIVVLISVNTAVVNGVCSFPGYYEGHYYSEQGGVDVETKIDDNVWEENQLKLECHTIYKITADDTNHERVINHGRHHKIITVKRGISDCYKCYWVFWRTPNILQFRTGSTCMVGYTPDKIKELCLLFPLTSSLTTMYNKKIEKVNCKNTFEGVYQFTYQLESGGICDHPGSKIEACQLPGSTYVENNVVDFTYMKCPEVSTSRNNKIRYLCLGAWRSEDNYTYGALAKTVEKLDKERFRCLLTRADQRPTDNTFRWTKSRFTECNKLLSTYTGYEKLNVKPVAPQTKYMIPACNLPRNISGDWFTMGQFKTDVHINETHIYFRRKLSEFKYLETYYSCQQTYGTRYMMTSVTIGQCEVDYVCFDLMPRHHSIVRFRVGKPFRMTVSKVKGQNDFMSTCNWLSFTRDREKTKWKYNVLVLNPPTPVPCPVAGRYYFTQKPRGKIPAIASREGVTPFPRMQVDCRRRVAAMSSCTYDMTRIDMDVNYCETVDYKGRPIGEYDEPDIVMSCVGYWMEDMKSFMITYDELDDESRYRCWVYKRISWTEIAMSRSSRAKCFENQEATTIGNGADLYIELSEQERLFDMCPQRFEDGYDPYKKPLQLHVIDSAHSITSQLALFVCSLTLAWVVL